LIPIAADTFLYPDGFNRLVLERDGGGRITAMRFFADGEGEGVVAPRTD
jgi:D-alanyl-D-alanine carboxypeptidase